MTPESIAIIVLLAFLSAILFMMVVFLTDKLINANLKISRDQDKIAVMDKQLTELLKQLS